MRNSGESQTEIDTVVNELLQPSTQDIQMAAALQANSETTLRLQRSNRNARIFRAGRYAAIGAGVVAAVIFVRSLYGVEYDDEGTPEANSLPDPQTALDSLAPVNDTIYLRASGSNTSQLEFSLNNCITEPFCLPGFEDQRISMAATVEGEEQFIYEGNDINFTAVTNDEGGQSISVSFSNEVLDTQFVPDGPPQLFGDTSWLLKQSEEVRNEFTERVQGVSYEDFESGVIAAIQQEGEEEILGVAIGRSIINDLDRLVGLAESNGNSDVAQVVREMYDDEPIIVDFGDTGMTVEVPNEYPESGSYNFTFGPITIATMTIGSAERVDLSDEVLKTIQELHDDDRVVVVSDIEVR